MKDPIVELRGVTRRFGLLVAVDRLSLQVNRSEIFGLVGPDGAGKTTTLRLLLGLMDPTEGEILILGNDVTKNPEAVRDSTGYMAQRFALYEDLTVDENMEFYADVYGISSQRRTELKPELLRMTRMAPFSDRRAEQLSGGMKQKLALMCALLHPTEILFLDEPTNGVDPVSRREFWAILYRLANQGLTVFLTTSYLDEAERCSRVALLHRGRLVECDAPDRLRQKLPYVCYEIKADDQPSVRRILDAQRGVLSTQPFGSALHVLADPERTDADVIGNALGGIPIQKISPTLEDVFMALIQEQEDSESVDAG